jgi:hypothetical protein
MLRAGALNVYASLPCPMKTPFKQLMSAFTAEYNASHAQKVYCPDVMDCSSEELGFAVRTTTAPESLPDVIIVNSYEFFFEYPFSERFLQTGMYQGITETTDWASMPDELRRNFDENNLGVLCFGSRSVVYDPTVKGYPYPVGSWRELLTPAYEDAFTVHGHIDKATFGLMDFLATHFGDEGIVRFAKNIADVKHFSQVIKRMCVPDEYRTPVNILPDVAAARIPSSKKVEFLQLEEGKLLSPIIIVVKTSKLDECSDLTAFFHSKPFRELLSVGCILPADLERGRKYFMPDFKTLTTDYKRLAEKYNRLFLDNLNMDKIMARQTDGGVCN